MEAERLELIVDADTSGLVSAINDAKQALDSLGSEAKEASSDVDGSVSDMGSSIGDLGTKINSGMGKVGTGLAVAGGALVTLASSTEEYRQNQAQLDAAFQQAGFSAEGASEVYGQLYKVIGDDDQAVESAANIAMLADSEQRASEWAELASGVLGTFHDTLQPEAFYESANETLKLGEATGAYAQMLEQTGVMSVEDFNAGLAACNTEAEKQDYMLQVSQKAMGAAGEAYDEATLSIQNQRDAQNELSGVLATIGEAMTPVLTAFTSFLADILGPLAQQIAPVAATYLPLLQLALEKAGAAVGAAFGFFVDNWEIFAGIAGVIGGIAAAIGLYNTVAAVKAAMDAAQVTSLTALIAAQWAQASATIAALAPYLLIVAAIAAVIAIIVLLVQNWDTVKETVMTVCENIKQKVLDMVSNVIIWFNAVKEGIKNKIEEAKTAATEKFEAIKAAIIEKVALAKAVVTTAFENIKNGIQTKIETAKAKVTSIFETIRSTIETKIQSAKDKVSTIFTDIKDDIDEKINAAKGFVDTAIQGIVGFLDFDWSWPSIPLPHFSISGSMNPLDWFDQGLPSIAVEWYAKGGVFDSPTLMAGIGEAGAEAVVPLENNLEWLDKLAGMLHERLGGGSSTPIVLQVDGKTFAQTAVTSMNALTRQQGRLGLNLV